ncbi:MAG: hypothetical protein JXR37_25490 [Kiritimatiellae bacterium]|nr:hypothetical protein [Kiritimatiellia bacterium]
MRNAVGHAPVGRIHDHVLEVDILHILLRVHPFPRSARVFALEDVTAGRPDVVRVSRIDTDAERAQRGGVRVLRAAAAHDSPAPTAVGRFEQRAHIHAAVEDVGVGRMDGDAEHRAARARADQIPLPLVRNGHAHPRPFELRVPGRTDPCRETAGRCNGPEHDHRHLDFHPRHHLDRSFRYLHDAGQFQRVAGQHGDGRRMTARGHKGQAGICDFPGFAPEKAAENQKSTWRFALRSLLYAQPPG